MYAAPPTTAVGMASGDIARAYFTVKLYMSTAGHSLDENEGAALACALAPVHVARPRAAQVRQRVGAAAVLQRAGAAWFFHAAAVQLARHVTNAPRESRLRAQLGEHLRYAQGWWRE